MSVSKEEIEDAKAMLGFNDTVRYDNVFAEFLDYIKNSKSECSCQFDNCEYKIEGADYQFYTIKPDGNKFIFTLNRYDDNIQEYWFKSSDKIVISGNLGNMVINYLTNNSDFDNELDKYINDHKQIISITRIMKSCEELCKKF